MNQDKIKEVLINSIVDEDNYKLSLPSERFNKKDYGILKKIILNIGGSWVGGNSQFFKFDYNPKPLIDKIINGEDINIKKDFQYFPTPNNIIKEMISYANLNSPKLSILEPSAGQGSIIKEIQKTLPNTNIDYCEFMEQNRYILDKTIDNINIKCDDFLSLDENKKYDRIIANPPFTRNSDIKHFNKMISVLKVDGILVSILSIGWIGKNQKIINTFKETLINRKARIKILDNQEFKDSGTPIDTCIIVIGNNNIDMDLYTLDFKKSNEIGFRNDTEELSIDALEKELDALMKEMCDEYQAHGLFGLI